MVSLMVDFRCMRWAYSANHARLWVESIHLACRVPFVWNMLINAWDQAEIVIMRIF